MQPQYSCGAARGSRNNSCQSQSHSQKAVRISDSSSSPAALPIYPRADRGAKVSKGMCFRLHSISISIFEKPFLPLVHHSPGGFSFEGIAGVTVGTEVFFPVMQQGEWQVSGLLRARQRELLL